MLPTCGWFYDWKAMRRAEVLHVRGETAGKTRLWRLAVAPGRVGSEIFTILPCSWLLLLLRSLVIAGLGIVEHPPRVRH